MSSNSGFTQKLSNKDLLLKKIEEKKEIKLCDLFTEMLDLDKNIAAIITGYIDHGDIKFLYEIFNKEVREANNSAMEELKTKPRLNCDQLPKLRDLGNIEYFKFLDGSPNYIAILRVYNKIFKNKMEDFSGNRKFHFEEIFTYLGFLEATSIEITFEVVNEDEEYTKNLYTISVKPQGYEIKLGTSFSIEYEDDYDEDDSDNEKNGREEREEEDDSGEYDLIKINFCDLYRLPDLIINNVEKFQHISKFSLFGAFNLNTIFVDLDKNLPASNNWLNLANYEQLEDSDPCTLYSVIDPKKSLFPDLNVDFPENFKVFKTTTTLIGLTPLFVQNIERLSIECFNISRNQLNLIKTMENLKFFTYGVEDKNFYPNRIKMFLEYKEGKSTTKDKKINEYLSILETIVSKHSIERKGNKKYKSSEITPRDKKKVQFCLDKITKLSKDVHNKKLEAMLISDTEDSETLRLFVELHELAAEKGFVIIDNN